LPDFSWYNIPKNGKNIPKDHKMFQVTVKYTQWQQKRPNCLSLKYQHLPLQDTPEFTQIVIFGLKINHLATMRPTLRIWLHSQQGRINFLEREMTDFGPPSHDICLANRLSIARSNVGKVSKCCNPERLNCPGC
jgi:hypothetical protein